MVRTTLVGNYPRVSDRSLPVNLRQMLHQHDRGEIKDIELERGYQATITRAVKEQEAAGIDLLTDGQIRWDDLLTPLTRQLDGAQAGGLLRWFDNNVYYRHPVIEGPLRWRGPATVADYRVAAAATTRPVKAVLPGPVTYASLSEDRFYKDFERLAQAVAGALHEEAQALAAAGAPWIQIDEPALGGRPSAVDLARTLLETITKGVKAKFALATYFKPIDGIYAALRTFPVDALQIDVVDRPDQLDLLIRNPPKGDIVLGWVDARNTRLEDRDQLTRLLEGAAEKLGADRLWASPNAGLEFLPHATALQKMARLAEAVAAVNGKTAELEAR
jgi:5-methyltetrahydropteroyltriglutamate--homocysteine methyltransferase